MPRKNDPGRARRPAPGSRPEQADDIALAADFVAVQQKSLDSPPPGVTRGTDRAFREERTMDQKTVFTQLQQFGTEWLKLVADQTNRFTAALAEAEKYERQGVAQAVSAVDEAGRVAKEAINAGEQFSAQWRKAMNEAAQRTLDLITPKN